MPFAIEKQVSFVEAASFLAKFVECSREVQGIVLEMVAIITDDSSTDDERVAAFDAMMEALDPGTAADLLQHYKERLAAGIAEANALKGEEEVFSDRLRKIMAEKNVSQSQIAEKIGVGQPAISNMLNRQSRPQRRTIVKLAEALAVSPDALWPGFSENPTP